MSRGAPTGPMIQRGETPAGVTFRRATAADAAIVAEFRRRMFDAMGEESETVPEIVGATEAYFVRALETGEFVAWLAEADGGPIGSVGSLVTEAPPMSHVPTGIIGRVQNVFVEPAWRRRGVARALLSVLLDDLKAVGVGAVMLVATDDGRALYESLGFEEKPSMLRSLDDWEGPPG